MKHIITAALFMNALALPVKAEHYLCIADTVVRFVIDETTGQWVPNVYDGTASKYLISVASGIGSAQVFGAFGSIPCQASNTTSGSEDIICGASTTQINLNTESLRFSSFSYLADLNESAPQRSPSLRIGACVNLEEADLFP